MIRTAAQRLLTMLDAREVQQRRGPSVDALPVIRALGKKDPAAALALAKTQPGYTHVPWRLLEAAAFQPKDAAKTILQQVFADERNRTIMNIAKANAIDPDFAKELYTKYKKTLEAESYHFTHRYNADDSSTE